MARIGISLAGVIGLAAVILMAMKVAGQRDKMNLWQRVGAVVLVALIALMIVAPPIGGFAGGFLIRPLLGFTSDSSDFREIFALLTVFAGTGVIFAAVYLLIAVQRVFFGPIRHAENEHLEDLSFREQAVLWPLAIVAVLMGLFPQPFLNMINPTVDAYARQFRTRAELPQMAMVEPLAPTMSPAEREAAQGRRRLPGGTLTDKSHDGGEPTFRVRRGQ